jgi:uncharacterized protein YndB with AHSA1/START domain
MTTRTEIKPADEATIGMAPDGRAFIRFERRLPHPVSEVWDAVVNPARMTDWLAYRVEIDPREGGKLDLWLGGREEPNRPDWKPHVSRSVITRFDPPRLLEAHGEDNGTLRFEVKPDGDGALFVFVHTLDARERSRFAIVAGWHLRMELLEAAFRGSAADWAALDASRDERGIVARIAEIYRHYQTSSR